MKWISLTDRGFETDWDYSRNDTEALLLILRILSELTLMNHKLN